MSHGRTPSRFQIRLVLLALVTSLFVVAVAGRLVYLTVFARDSLRERGELQHQHTLKLDARRGTIHDRNGSELATSVEVESVYAVPRAYTSDRIGRASKLLGRCLELDESRIAERLTGGKRFVWLERKAKPETVRCLRSLDLAGVGFLPESRRFYPKRQLASQVLGYVGIDNKGMGGVEYALEDEIQGESGRRIIWTDALMRRASSRIEERPVPGRSAYLTIDENLQFIAETELNAAIVDSHAKSGIAILMRPATGELLAMASFPSFNPNRYARYPQSHWRNRSVTDVYEPGSTFKIVTAAAALEEGVTTENERIDCGRGMIRVSGRTIRDHRVFDVLTFREVIGLSSNVGMIRIGQRLGRERLGGYIEAFGFGSETGIELPAESRGILRPFQKWGPVTVASISFGQEIGVTPIQMVAAANAIATSGYLMRPRLLLGFGGDEDRAPPTVTPEPVRRVVSEETARRLTDLLVGVVEHGTGERAAIPGYRVAGKTGTAQKAVRGGYSKTDYIASFVGFVPAHHPALTALVILDSPRGDHSGSRAAAVFARIVGRSLRYLGVPSDDEPAIRVAKVWPQTRPILRLAETPDGKPESMLSPLPVSAEPGGAGSMSSRVPDVFGLAARDALARFLVRGVVPELVGQGWVAEQQPPPGQPIESGSRPRLVLSPSPVVAEPHREAPPRGGETEVRLARAGGEVGSAPAYE